MFGSARLAPPHERCFDQAMPTIDTDVEDPRDHADEPDTLFVDAATRVSNPSKFDDWYYGIEDKLGQGTVGMGVCLLMFIIILIVAIVWNPI